jgi:cytidylate kinase
MAILTMSRQLGSGAREIRLSLMDQLRYGHIDKNVIFNDIREMGGKWEKWANEFDQTSPRIWEKYDWSFKGYGVLLQSVMLTHAEKDNVILAGRGSNFLLEGIAHAFRVRIVAPVDERIRRLASRESINTDNARLLIERTDQERAGFIKAVYGKDLNDPEFYDAFYDTHYRSLEEIADEIKEIVLSKDKLKTEVSREILHKRAVAAKIKAKIVTDPALYIPVFDVEATSEGLKLRGVIRNPDQYERIVNAARELAGDLPVKIELSHRA